MGRKDKGRRLLTSVAAFTTVSGFLFDWNRWHLSNSDWPPHAKFHAAQSVVLASLLGTGGLYFLHCKGEHQERDLALGTLLPSLLYLSMAASFAFPGAEGAEFQSPEKIPQVRGVWLNERFFSATMLALLAIGYASGKEGHR